MNKVNYPGELCPIKIKSISKYYKIKVLYMQYMQIVSYWDK